MEAVFAHFAGIAAQQIQLAVSLLHSAESIIPIASNQTVNSEFHSSSKNCRKRHVKRGCADKLCHMCHHSHVDNKRCHNKAHTVCNRGRKQTVAKAIIQTIHTIVYNCTFAWISLHESDCCANNISRRLCLPGSLEYASYTLL